MGSSLFQSFFMGGFECSSHRLNSGRRLDLLASTQHDQYHAILADYIRLNKRGIFTVRDGIRWHLIETKAYSYDFSSVLPFIHAARQTGTQVIWDLFHYGWPDDLDIFTPQFIDRFAGLAAAFVRLLSNELPETPFLTPVNEISFMAWGGGDTGFMNPFAHGRGPEVKAQLVRAAVAATEAIWAIAPQARIVQIDPVIHIVNHPDHPQAAAEAEAYRLAQYQTWDMIAGRLAPELGGQEKYLDIIGVNYYAINQWFHQGRTIYRHEASYKPFREILNEVYTRYGRPLFVAETGDEGWVRPGWLNYVSSEVRAALQAGVPVEGICLYPILNHPGWHNERYCHNGLWGYADPNGKRKIYRPLARELQRQQRLLKQLPSKPTLPALAESDTGGTSCHSESVRRKTPAKISTSVKGTGPAICLFTDSLEPSGVGEHMLALASNLLYTYPILFVCPSSPKGDYVLARAAAIGCQTLALEVRGEPADQTVLADWLHQMAVEIFHCHAGTGWEGHAGIYTARDSDIPVIIRTEHLPYLLTETHDRLAYEQIVQTVDQLICVSQAAYESYIEAGVPAQKLTVIRNGICVPAPRYDRAGIREQLGLPADAKIVLTIARLIEQKGHTYLADAIPTILAQAPQTYFVWVGEGPLEDELRAQIQHNEIDEAHVIFAGWRTDASELLAAADLFVLPSLFEGLPLAVLEALAIGIPVVGTRVGGTWEVIEDGVNGRLVEPRNSAALAGAVIEALTKSNLVAQWCKAGRASIDQTFNVIRMVGELVTLYESLRSVRPMPRRELQMVG
ncbi:hypothetical protein BH10CHL1_BH10CHL1_01010 [soil metagenome]